MGEAHADADRVTEIIYDGITAHYGVEGFYGDDEWGVFCIVDGALWPCSVGKVAPPPPVERPMPEPLIIEGEVQSYSVPTDPTARIAGWDVVSDRHEPLRFVLEAYWGQRVRVAITLLDNDGG